MAIVNGTLTGLDWLDTSDKFAAARAVTRDGTVVVGYSMKSTDNNSHPVFWSGGAAPIQLDATSPGSGTATAVSDDGKVIGGTLAFGDNDGEATLWQINGAGVVMQTVLGSAIGATSGSSVTAIAANGSALLGKGTVRLTVGTGTHALLWSVASPGTAIDLSIHSTDSSTPVGISFDGTVAVANYSTAADLARARSSDDSPYRHVLRWASGQSTDIGTLGLGSSDEASAMSADGSIIVGTESRIHSELPIGFVWTTTTGIVSVADRLSAGGIDSSAYRLISANGISADGTIVMGQATPDNRTNDAVLYLARLPDASTYHAPDNGGTGGTGGTGGGGFVTGDVLDTSLAALGAPPDGNNDHIGWVLDEFGQFGPPRTGGPSGFASGSFDSDPAASGSVGFTTPLGGDLDLGVVVDVGRVTADLTYGGSSDFRAVTASAFLARNADTGLQMYLGVGGDLLKGTVARGYLNGAAQVSSAGDTDGYGLGTKGQLGWRLGDAKEGASLLAFASATLGRTHIRGYTEQGGPFPATIGALDASNLLIRAGVEAQLANPAGFALSGRVALVRNIVASGPISGTVSGLLGVSGSGSTSASDWLETGAGVTVPMGPSADASLSVLARFPVHGVRSYAGQAGMRFAF